MDFLFEYDLTGYKGKKDINVTHIIHIINLGYRIEIVIGR